MDKYESEAGSAELESQGVESEEEGLLAEEDDGWVKEAEKRIDYAPFKVKLDRDGVVKCPEEVCSGLWGPHDSISWRGYLRVMIRC